MRHLSISLAWAVCAATFAPHAAFAQDPPSESGLPPAPVVEAPEEEPPSGDVVTLTNGKVISRIQVLRTASTPTHYAIELMPGLDPVLIPRKAVTKVEYDDIEPSPGRSGPAENVETAPSRTLEAERVAPGLMTKLNRPLGDAPIVFEDADFVDVLRSLATRADVVIEIDPRVLEMEEDRRGWSIHTEETTSLSSLLREDFRNAFTDLEVVYQYDKIVVTPKSENETRPANSQNG